VTFGPMWLQVLGLVIVVAIVGGSLLSGGKRPRGGGTRVPWVVLKPRLGVKGAVRRAQQRLPAAAFTHEDGKDDRRAVWHLARYGRHEVFAQHEDAVLVIGPSGSGKSHYFAKRAVLEAIGPTLTTSTKGDVVRASLSACLARGQVTIYDLGDVLSASDTRGAEPFRWDPVPACVDPEVALQRGAAWAAAQPMKHVGNADWFSQRAAELLARLLHAAALDGRTIMDVARWAQNISDREPGHILERSGPAGWSDWVRSLQANSADQTMGSLQMTLTGILGALASPKVAQTLTPRRGEGFDPRAFLDAPNSLHLVADQRLGSIVAPVFTMIVDEILTVAGNRSQVQDRGFLWPPLRCVLDELPNLAPIPRFDGHMSDSGSRGIQLIPIVQSRAQMRDRFGTDSANAIWGTAAMRLLLPGVREADLLQEVSQLAGRHEVARSTTTVSGQGRSRSHSMQWEDRLRPEQISEIPLGTAWMLYRELPPVRVTLLPPPQ